MKKTLLALALAGIATASFGFTVYSNDVASLTLSSNLKANFGYSIKSVKTDNSKIKSKETFTVKTKQPTASLKVDDLDFAGDFTLDNYKTGFDLQLKVLNGYTFNTSTKTTVELAGKSHDLPKDHKKAAKYEVYKFTELSSTPFSIYFETPTLGKLTLGVNNDGIGLDSTDADTQAVNSSLDDDENANKYLLQYDSFKFYNNFTAGASLTFTSMSKTSLNAIYAGYVTYELSNSDTVNVTALKGVAYTYNANQIRLLNNDIVAYQLAYTNSSLVDNLTFEVAYQHSKSVAYDSTSLEELSGSGLKDKSMNENGLFLNANYVFNDYLKPYVSIAYLNQKTLADNTPSVNTISGGVGLNSTLYSDFGVTVSSNLEVNGSYSKDSLNKMYETSVPTVESTNFNFKGYLKLAF